MENCKKKILKRKQIAQSCASILEKTQYHNVSISKLASEAGIGKGTIYEYFENKEDIVFELMTCMQESYDKNLFNLLENTNCLKEKLHYLFMLFLSDDVKIIHQREIYKQFITICISNPSDKIKKFNSQIRNKYINILDKMINNKEEATQIYDKIISIYINSNTLSNYNLKENMNTYINKLTIKE